MPNLSGYDVCVQLKADSRTRDVPIIFLSASNEAFNKVKAFSLGGVDYITKPFQTTEVLARVEMHVTHRRAQQELEEKNRQLELEIAKRVEAEALLQSANAMLEQRVEARMAELTRANAILKQEIDERIQIEQALSTTVKRFQSLIEYSVDIVVILDRKGYFRYISPSARRILGYSSADLVGQRIFDLVHRDDSPDLVRTLTAGLHNLDATARLIFRFPHHAGGWRALRGTARNMLDEPTINGLLLNLHETTAP
jgi:PAS domain S-box-containing protein